MYPETKSLAEHATPLKIATVCHRPSRVLLVDDDLFTLGVLDDMLRELGVKGITKALGGISALAALDAMSVAPDLVMCDLNMPGGDGFQFMEQLGGRSYKGAIVVMSGMNHRTMHSATLMARFHRLKIAGALGKPITASALSAVLGNLG